MSIEEVFFQLKTSSEGLSETEAENRLQEYGHNKLIISKRRSGLTRFFSQFHNLLIYILLGAACVTFFLGKYLDMVVILALVFVNATIGFFQEGKAERAIDAVSRMLSLTANVIRDQKRFSLAAEKLVPGDIVLVQSGDKVPADIRLFEIKNLKVSEALLTGESEPIEKKLSVLNENVIVNDQINMIFSGTLVTNGTAKGVVIATGEQTEIGKIGQLLAKVPVLTTPLLKKISAFSRWLTFFILLMASFIFTYGLLFKSYTLEEMLIAAVSIAVAAIPEGLPIILTITLAIGVQRMAKRHAIIRRLPAVETLGSVMIICSDKTGTLTQNEMMAQSVCLGERKITVTGSGYDPKGEFYEDEHLIDVKNQGDLQEICKASILCNEANFSLENGEIKLHGDPTEGALLTLGLKIGFDHHLVHKEFPTTDTIPFESEHRFMATLHHDHAGHGFIYIKGAPEVIFQRCSKQRINGQDYPFVHNYWQQQVERLGKLGQRTLAIAFKAAPTTTSELMFDAVESELVLLGLVGIIDPPRNEAIRSVHECHKAGIRVKMITGDHATTAHSIANQVGIESDRVLTGDDLDQMSDQEFLISVDQNNIFARTSPEHKLRLVKALQAKGYIVAMTGDGVNDSPALKRADIGIAMGMKGTEAAKEASDIVLTDDNFASIVEAIKQGRTVYDNLKKVITFLLPINGGESLSLVVAILLGYTLPITPLQILWVNLVSSVTLAMALAFEPTEKSVMQRKPIPPNESLLSRLLVWRILFISSLFLLGIFGIFKWAIWQKNSIEVARTLAVNTLVMLEVFYLFSSRYIHGPSLTWQGIQGTKAVLLGIGLVTLLQLLFTYTPFMHYLFQTQSITIEQGLWVWAIGIVGFILFETEKLSVLFFKRKVVLK